MNILAHEAKTNLEAAQNAFKTAYAAFPDKTLPDGTKAKDIPANALEGLTKMRSDMDAAGKAYEDAIKLDEAFGVASKGVEPTNRLGAQKGSAHSAKSLLDVMDAKGITARGLRQSNQVMDLAFDDEKSAIDWLQMKTTVSTSAGFAPFVMRTGDVVPAISRPVQLLDYLGFVPTTQNSIKFMYQSTRTNAAAGKAEATALDESAMAWTEATANIEKVGTFIPVTEVQLEDEPQIRSIIENDLVLMVRQELDRQITVGSGGSPTITGIYASSGVQTQAKSTDPVLDALLKGMTKVRVTGRANPNVVVLHANDHQDLALTRTADGLYILGDPSNQPLTRVWGLPIVLSEALTEGNGMVLDSRYFKVYMRKDVTLAVSDSHASTFTTNVLTFRAHVRAGLVALRGEAACKVTGI